MNYFEKQSQGATAPSSNSIFFLEKIASQLPAWRERIGTLLAQHGSEVIGEVTVAKAYGGMRGVFALVTEISSVDPYDGLVMRGLSIDQLIERLPKAAGSQFPLLGGLFYLLMVGEIPSLEESQAVEAMWQQRQGLPEHVTRMLAAMPADTHPMTLLAQALMALQPFSAAARAYQAGISREDYWHPTLEDALNLTANLPLLAATIYNLKYRQGAPAIPDPDLDWGANFAYMIGKEQDQGYLEYCRLFMLLHADQESGNACAHTSHLVGSTLSDLYLSAAAGINALAGPLHGLASQETLRWLLALQELYPELPTHEQLEAFALDTLNQGKVIPGYGHGVLRRTDTRFTAQLQFAEQWLPDDPLFQLVRRVYEVIPGVLAGTNKINNPNPNVDAISGSIQYHFGITQPEFSTVLFGSSRLLGLSAHAVWARALGLSIERPRSLTTAMIEAMVTPTVAVHSSLSNPLGVSRGQRQS